MESSTFKSVAFGGFAKQDVVDYIERTAREAAAVQEKLQQENDGLREEADTLRQQVETLRAQVEALQAERALTQEHLAEESAARQSLEPFRQEAQTLREEVERLRPDAEAYAQFRERLGAIECEARKRAADLENATVARMERVSSTFRTRYQEAASAFDAAAAHVTGELRKVEVNLSQLPRALDQAGADLKELEKMLESAKNSR